MNTINGLSDTKKKYFTYFQEDVILFCKTPKKGHSNAMKIEYVTPRYIKVRYLYDDLSKSQEFYVYFKREIWRLRRNWIKSREKAWGSYKPEKGGHNE